MAKISAYSAITNVQPNDQLVVVDVNDTTMAPTGTTKNMTLSQLGAFQPWQFQPSAYGTVHGDVQVVTDGAMSSSSGTTTLTCATSAPFKIGDIGKHFIVNGAASSSGLALTGTITGYTDSSHVTTSVACTNTVTGAAVVWGTDDTAPFQAAINAAVTYMEATGYAQVYIPMPAAAGYMIAGSLVTSGYANSVLTIGTPSYTAAQGTLDITGAAGEGVLPFWAQVAPQIAGGVVLVSPYLWTSQGAQSSNFSSFYDAAVLGAVPSNAALPPQVGGYAAYSNIAINVSDLTVMTPQTYQGTNLCGINLRGAAKGTYTRCAALFTVNYNNSTAPNQMPSTSAMLGGLSIGLVLPGNGNNARSTMRDCSVMGFAFGTNLGEEIVIDGSAIIGCGCGLKYYGNDPTNSEHLAQVYGTTVQHCYKLIYVQGIGGGNGCQIDATIDVEVIQGGAGSALSDSNSGAGLASLFGRLRVAGIYNNNILATPYPTNLEIISDNYGPGWVFSYAGFSSAGTGVAVQNPYFRPARVYWSGGTVATVSAGVTIGGTSGSPTTAPSMTQVTTASSGLIDWPSGGWLSFTYTGSPAWNVCLS